jgi:hypothetical protein
VLGRRLVVLHARRVGTPAPKICTSIDPPYPIIAIYTSCYSPLGSVIGNRFLQWAKIGDGGYIRRQIEFVADEAIDNGGLADPSIPQ